MDLTGLSACAPCSTAELDRRAVARDLWPRSTLRVATGEEVVLPQAVVSPRTEAEVQAVLAWASAAGVPVVPYGAGSGVCGAAAAGAGITLDLKRLRTIGTVDADRRWVSVGAGVIGQHLEDHLAVSGFVCRHSPSSIWCSTVGGWAASRSAGQFSSRYGTFPDMVAAMRVVSPSGAYGTGVWAEGEDLGPWLLGTEGSLGVITELLVRVVPVPERRWLRGYRFASVDAALRAMRRLLQGELHPAVLRLYDPVDTRLAGKGTATKQEGSRWLTELAARVREIPLLRRNALLLPLSLPKLVNRLIQAGASGCVLIAGWEGSRAPTEALAAAGHAEILDEGGEDLGSGPGEHWYEHRHEVSYKMAPIFMQGGFADTMEVASSWGRLGELYASVRAALGQHGVVMAHFSHAYIEGCSIYFTFAGRGSVAVYDAAWRDALAAAAAAGGTVAHHHGVGQLKMAAAGRELAGLAPMYRALKERLDPAGILNPGRLFPPVDEPEPPKPVVAVDPESRTATLDAHEPAASRDAWLAACGWELRFPCTGTLASALTGVGAAAHEPWETPIVGASARTAAGRVVLPAVSRSSAGPDLRAGLRSEDYETLTVPVVPRGEGVVRVERPWAACVARDLRPARRDGAAVEFRGPAAAALAHLAEAIDVD